MPSMLVFFFDQRGVILQGGGEMNYHPLDLATGTWDCIVQDRAFIFSWSGMCVLSVDLFGRLDLTSKGNKKMQS